MDKSTQGLVQWIKDLYASGAKLWTKEMLSDIEAELAQNPVPKTISIRSIRSQLDLDCTKVSSKEQSKDEIQTLATRGVKICFSTFSKSNAEYSKVQQSWVQAQQNWLNSSLCKELSEIIGSTVDKSRAVTKIVCFGLGSLARSIEDPIHIADDGLPVHGPGTQHAAALTLSTILGERLGRGPIPVMVRDPAYSEADKRILEKVGIEVIGGFGSLGFTYVDEETIVFSCHPNIPVRQITADIAKPAAMIWNKGRFSEEKAEYKVFTRQGKEVLSTPYFTDHDSPRTAKLLQDYDEFEFPNCHSRFGDLAIYVRKR
ncbi:unnamed protein product, partial [Clonostachys byssicola]